MVSAANKGINKSAQLTLIAGGHYRERELAIMTALQARTDLLKSAVILEGLPSGQSELHSQQNLLLERIAPGCFCCIGHLVLQVTLNRLLRQRPDYLYLAMSDPSHLTQLQNKLLSPPYADLLKLENVMTL